MCEEVCTTERYTEGIFASVNSERDRIEEKERQKCHRAGVGMFSLVNNAVCIM